MIVERISMLAIYRSLKQLETNEGRLYDIVVSRKMPNGAKSPEAFKSLDDMLAYTQRLHPWVPEYKQSEVCTWYPYTVSKFWIDKNNGTLVEFKELVTVKKVSSLFDISLKRLTQLATYLRQVDLNNKNLIIDPYISPSTATYVDCVYIDDLIKNSAYYFLIEEYAKYIKP